MPGSRPDSNLPHDEDLDPTGVRDMLANLPDPGPMPEALVARISQSILLEQERRTQGSATLASDSSPSETPVSLAAERHRRRPARTVLWLGGAAAVAMVATASVNQFFDDGTDSGVSAQAPAREASDAGRDAGSPAPAGSQPDAAADGAASADSDSLTDGESAQEDAAAPQASTGTDVQGMSGTLSLSETNVAAQVEEWLTAEPTPGATSWTIKQVNDCIEDQGLDTSATAQVVVSNANWTDEPAMVLVARTSTGGTAWVLTPSCDSVLTGPIALN